MKSISRTTVRAKQELNRHSFDYLLLITGSVFFLIVLNMVRGQKFNTFLALLSFASLYCIWGIAHHVRDNSLHLKTVLEYILISFSVVALLTLLINY